MASNSVKHSILKVYPELRKGILAVKQNVFGEAPPSYNNMRTGYKFCAKQLTGTYSSQYFDGSSIDKIARKYNPGYKTEQEERREEKLALLRRRGKGPPKKGSGKRKRK